MPRTVVALFVFCFLHVSLVHSESERFLQPVDPMGVTGEVKATRRPVRANGTASTSSTLTLSGFGTATLDGVISPGEWDAAGSVNFLVNLPGGGTAPATLFVMNDAANLYLALRFARNVVDPGNSLDFEFDNNDDGIAANGDDVIVLNPDVGFTDIFRTNAPPCPLGSPPATCTATDVSAGGTNDGAGVFANDGTFSVYEMSHPLNSGDIGHDFALSAGKSVGFFLFLRMIRAPGVFPQDFGDTYFPGFRDYGHILIAAPNTPAPTNTPSNTPTNTPTPGTGKDVTITGSMEGDLHITNGDFISAGYHFDIHDKNHPATTVTVTGASVTIPVTCDAGGTDIITVPLPDASYFVAAGDTSWIPTGDQNSILSWQASVVVAACGGGTGVTMRNQIGATFHANVLTSPHVSPFFQFHYRDPAAKGKPNTACNVPGPNRDRADVCGASWSSTVDP